MAIGDDALAAGMQLVDGATQPGSDLDDEINRTRDYIAQRTSTVTPISKGGTGATTASAARTALGIDAGNVPGLGADGQTPQSVQGTLTWLGGRAAALQAAIAALENDMNGLGSVVPAGEALARWNGAGQMATQAPSLSIHAANKQYVDSTFMPIAGGQFTGDVRFPTATPATSGYVVAYLNNDGRLSRGASSERYKEQIAEVDPADLGDIFPALHRFQMRDGDGAWKYGWIAERLEEHPDQAAFVVHDEEGRPDSIDFIALLIAQNAQLVALVDDLRARVAKLEEA